MSTRTSPLPISRTTERVDFLDQVRGLLVVLSALVILFPPLVAEWDRGHRASWLLSQFEPPIWHGCSLHDLMIPGFLFLAGFSTSLSVSRRRREGDWNASLFKHLLWRNVILFLLGLILDGGLLSLSWPWRITGVLQQIAVCRFGVGVVMILADWKISLFLAGLLLINYGAMLEIITDASELRSHSELAAVDGYFMNHNFAAVIDQRFLPGRKYFESWDPQGLLATVPALAVALLGAASSRLINNQTEAQSWATAWGVNSIYGLALLQTGIVLSLWIPLNPWLLTPPLALVASGASLIALGCLALFQRPANWLSQTGRNCLVLMLAIHLIEQFGFVILSSFSESTGIPLLFGHTLVTVGGGVALLGINSRLSSLPSTPNPLFTTAAKSSKTW